MNKQADDGYTTGRLTWHAEVMAGAWYLVDTRRRYRVLVAGEVINGAVMWRPEFSTSGRWFGIAAWFGRWEQALKYCETEDPARSLLRTSHRQFQCGPLTWDAWFWPAENKYTIEDTSGLYVIEEVRAEDPARDPDNRGPWHVNVWVAPPAPGVTGFAPLPVRFEYYMDAVRFAIDRYLADREPDPVP